MNVVDLRGRSTGDAAGLAALAAAVRGGVLVLAQAPHGRDRRAAQVLATAADVLDEVAHAMRAATDPRDLAVLEARLVAGLHEPLQHLAVLRGHDVAGTD